MGNLESVIQDAYSVESRPRPNLRNLGDGEATDLMLPASWTYDRRKAARRIKRFMKDRKKAKKKWDTSVQEFAFSEAYFSHRSNDIEWECCGIL